MALGGRFVVKSVTLQLVISADELQRWYQGRAQQIVATAIDGKKVRFPVNILRPFVTHEGISGTFNIVFNDAGEFHQIHEVYLFGQ